LLSNLNRPTWNMLGEHTEVLLEALCGVAPDETKRMRQDGVV
jgi:formyl-CoA transferase